MRYLAARLLKIQYISSFEVLDALWIWLQCREYITEQTQEMHMQRRG